MNPFDAWVAPIQIDFRAKTPPYLQLSEQIRAQIIAGQVAPDSPLPPVRSLAERLHINFNTVARAYRLLDIEGWISTQPGRGTYLTPQSWPYQPGKMQVEPVEAPDASDGEAGRRSPADTASGESARSIDPERQESSAIAQPVFPSTPDPGITDGVTRDAQDIPGAPAHAVQGADNPPNPIDKRSDWPPAPVENRLELIQRLLEQAAASGVSLAEIQAYLHTATNSPDQPHADGLAQVDVAGNTTAGSTGKTNQMLNRPGTPIETQRRGNSQHTHRKANRQRRLRSRASLPQTGVESANPSRRNPLIRKANHRRPRR